MSLLTVNLQTHYESVFGSKPHISAETEKLAQESGIKISGQNRAYTTVKGSTLTTEFAGKEIWLPVKFVNLDPAVFGVSEMLLPWVTIKISGQSEIVRTPMAERGGKVKELYSIDDYKIEIRGYLIGYDASGIYPEWPEEQLIFLKKMHELGESIELDNALTNVFLDQNQKVVVTSFDLGHPKPGQKHVYVFSMKLESDSIFDLTVTD